MTRKVRFEDAPTTAKVSYVFEHDPHHKTPNGSHGVQNGDAGPVSGLTDPSAPPAPFYLVDALRLRSEIYALLPGDFLQDQEVARCVEALSDAKAYVQQLQDGPADLAHVDAEWASLSAAERQVRLERGGPVSRSVLRDLRDEGVRVAKLAELRAFIARLQTGLENVTPGEPGTEGVQGGAKGTRGRRAGGTKTAAKGKAAVTKKGKGVGAAPAVAEGCDGEGEEGLEDEMEVDEVVSDGLNK